LDILIRLKKFQFVAWVWFTDRFCLANTVFYFCYCCFLFSCFSKNINVFKKLHEYQVFTPLHNPFNASLPSASPCLHIEAIWVRTLKLDIVLQAYNPSTREAVAGGSWIQNHPGQYCNSSFKKVRTPDSTLTLTLIINNRQFHILWAWPKESPSDRPSIQKMTKHPIYS
jgi:hypothetical protein